MKTKTYALDEISHFGLNRLWNEDPEVFDLLRRDDYQASVLYLGACSSVGDWSFLECKGGHTHFTAMCAYKQLYGPCGGLILIGKGYDLIPTKAARPLCELFQKSAFPRCSKLSLPESQPDSNDIENENEIGAARSAGDSI